MFNRLRTILHGCRQACGAPWRTLAVAVATTLALAAAQAQDTAAIFQIGDLPGEIHLSDRADAKPGVDVRRMAGPPGESQPGRAAAREGLSDIVRTAAAGERLAPALIDAVIAVESAYQVRAVSARGASGLMQLMPATAKLYGVTDIFDPRQNVAAGARHLRRLLDRYDQDIARALAAYNAGTGAIDRAGAQHGRWPSETTSYVPRVLGRYAALGSPAPPGTSAAATP